MRCVKPTMLVGAVCAFVGTAATAQFSDNFDSYNAGQGLVEQNGTDYQEWCGSGGNGTFDIEVVNAPLQAHTGDNYIHLEINDDVVRRVDATSGRWRITVQTFIPTGQGGRAYFILLNRYGGDQQSCNTDNNWSSQLIMDGNGGQTGVWENDEGGNTRIPVVTGQWVELRYEIDLDSDTYEIFYGGNAVPLDGSGGNTWSDDGVAEIAVIDLYNQLGQNYNLDTLVVERVGGGGENADLNSITLDEGDFLGGGVPQISSSDDQYYQVRMNVTGEAAEAHRMNYRVAATTNVNSPSSMEITFEGNAQEPVGSIVTLYLRDQNTNQFEQVGQFANGPTDSTNVVNVANAGQYVDGSGNIELRVKKHVVAPTGLAGTFSNDDFIQIAVQ